MASIDKYEHKLLDYFHCPSDFELVYQNSTREIAIYQLEQDIPADEPDFDGKKGDLLLGGGSGEAESLRISIKGIKFFTNNEFDDFNSGEELVKSFWTPNFSYKVGNGLEKLAWTPDENMEFWLAEKIIEQLFKKEKITVPNTRHSQ